MRVHTSSLIERWLEPYMRRFLARHEQAQRWTTKHCYACSSPVSFDGAAYCAFCGVSLTVPRIEAAKPVEALPVSAAAPLPVEMSATTDALYRLNLRPMNAFNEMRRNGAGVKTAMTEAINLEKLRKNKGFKP